jgi:hypothetical protein
MVIDSVACFEGIVERIRESGCPVNWSAERIDDLVTVPKGPNERW